MKEEIKEYSEKEIYLAISAAFEAFYILARRIVKIAWKKMSKKGRYDSGRALIFVKNLATDPAECFSRSKTEKAWERRAAAFLKARKISSADEASGKSWKFSPPDSAFYRVSTPRNLVANKAQAAFHDDFILLTNFEDFCGHVQDWEYDRTYSEDSPIGKFGLIGVEDSARKILEESEKIQRKARATRMYRIMDRRKRRVLKYSREGIKR